MNKVFIPVLACPTCARPLTPARRAEINGVETFAYECECGTNVNVNRLVST